MFDEPTSIPEQSDDLQVDQDVDVDPQHEDTGMICKVCSQLIVGEYYDVNGQVTCTSCSERLAAVATGGSGSVRFVRATVLGVVAGAVGAAIWFGIRMGTGYELGLVAIGVGFLVGGAVRYGAKRRGGWVYQLLAVFIAYSAIIANYVPDSVVALSSGDSSSAQETVKQQGNNEGSAENAEIADRATEDDETIEDIKWEELSNVEKFIYVIFVFVTLFIFLLPQMAMSGDIIGLLFVAFAIYEAWKMNKRISLQITGPYTFAENSSLELDNGSTISSDI